MHLYAHSMCTYTYKWVCVYLHTCISVHAYIRITYIHTLHTHIHTYTHTYPYIHMLHKYTYIHTHLSQTGLEREAQMKDLE